MVGGFDRRADGLLIACLSAWRCVPPGVFLTSTTIGSVLISHSVVYLLLTMLNFFFRGLSRKTEAILPIGILALSGAVSLKLGIYHAAGQQMSVQRVPVSIRRANLIAAAVFTGIVNDRLYSRQKRLSIIVRRDR